MKYVDNTTGGVNQTGERKTLPFRTKSVTSSGEIRISSDKNVVVFFDKVFKVTNELIEGSIKYEDNGSTYDVAHNEFVAFFVQSTGVRIGAITITGDGKFSLNLRKEYAFDWYNDKVEFDYIRGDKVYDLVFDSLDDLYRKIENGQTIVLTEAQTD